MEQMTGPARDSTAGARNESVSAAVIDAVAEANGVDPLDLEPRLNDIVDPDALERLFRYGAAGESPSSGRIVFRMAGCEVVVHGAGRVTATPDSNDDREAVSREISPRRPAGRNEFDG